MSLWDADKFDCLMDEIEVRKPTSFRPPWVTDYVIDTSATVPFPIQGNGSAVGLYVGDQELAHSDIVRCVLWDDANQQLYTGGEDGRILAWSMQQSEPPEAAVPPPSEPGTAHGGRPRLTGIDSSKRRYSPRMFPHATVLVLLSTLQTTFLSRPSATRSTAQLIKDELLRAGRDASETGAQAAPQMAVHYFSNGGMATLSTMMKHLHDMHPDMPSPMATIFDCVPGVLTEPIFRDAATMSDAPGSWKYWLHVALVRLYFLRMSWFGYGYQPMDNVETAKKYQNIPSTWHWAMQRPVSHKLPPRLYLNTLADAFISPASVTEHAAEAQRVNGESPAHSYATDGLEYAEPLPNGPPVP
ncbi:hypothetical protein MCAP1_000560 [Malassezia caprae]|uniref:Uncharacterized protein n=1 Tax=Malassezia caprae TaxID=1381934 RepID=A0AAF0E3Y6_9BASI|nr:hypothetical protein MCAP1_000560 [Malassezia caprae]